MTGIKEHWVSVEPSEERHLAVHHSGVNLGRATSRVVDFLDQRWDQWVHLPSGLVHHSPFLNDHNPYIPTMMIPIPVSVSVLLTITLTTILFTLSLPVALTVLPNAFSSRPPFTRHATWSVVSA